ncbi:MAG: haloalkane dehalogenase [Cycloclasticus sp.]|nr:haloalkane dehalogenase [Cycloclasticus sp.]
MNAKFPYKKKFKTIHGSRMAYVDEGVGDPILFLHGNPTSSYLWRNIMPYFEGQGRLIAPDLIGMGDSDKLPNSGPNRYTYVEHRKYLFSLLDELGVNENVTFVIHDWGSGLGFHWAHTHPEAVKAIAFMEAIIAPIPDWESFPADARPIFQGFRSDAGEKMILEDNLFIEQILPALIRRALTDEEMNAYRKPFLNAGEDRRPTLTFPRQLPIAGEPEDIVEIVTAYGNWLTQSQIPKFFVNAEPGTLSAPSRGFIRSLPNVTEITVDGFHYVQEDAPDEIGREISAWLANI